jgi:hypothetical protein
LPVAKDSVLVALLFQIAIVIWAAEFNDALDVFRLDGSFKASAKRAKCSAGFATMAS